jgi:LmbE family N-acetylglucosaminyl deacetylase
MLLETDLIPYSLSQPVGERVIVLAPHPDDETLGMGGSLRLLAKAGKKIKVVVVTCGEKADPGASDRRRYTALRQREALKAFKVMGIADYEFLGFPDRELTAHMSEVEKAIKKVIAEFTPDVVYSPSLIELNPDHRVTAELALKVSQNAEGVSCIFYEITTPFRPNILVDITGTFRYKKKAIKCHKSQLKLTDYFRLAKAMNAYRTFTLGRGVKFAEAFWEIRGILSKEDLRKWLSYEIPLLW